MFGFEEKRPIPKLERCGRCYVSPLQPQLGLCPKCDALLPCARPGCGEPFWRHRPDPSAGWPPPYTFTPYGKPATCAGFVVPKGWTPREPTPRRR